jgi:hypothetical protein
LKISDEMSEPRATRKTAAFCLPAMSLTFLGFLEDAVSWAEADLSPPPLEAVCCAIVNLSI